MRVAISDACGSHFGNANLDGEVWLYEIDDEEYFELRHEFDDPEVVASLVKEHGKKVEQLFKGEILPV